MSRRRLGIVIVSLGLLYPFFVYLALPRLSPLWVLAVLALLLGLRAIFLWRDKALRGQVWPLIAGLLVIALIAVFDRILAVKAYPVMISFAVAAMFAYALYRPPCLVERMARLLSPGLNRRGVAYARRVSALWLAFGLINGGISIFTAVSGSLEVWTIYNGLIAYLAMGLLFGGEFIVRQFVKASHIGPE